MSNPVSTAESESNFKQEREGFWSGGWARLIAFALLVYLGIELAIVLSPRLRGVAWLLFFLIWVPISIQASYLITRLLKSFANPHLAQPPERASLSAVLRCAYCGKSASASFTICPNCFEDLKVNCQKCGRMIDAKSTHCTECTKSQARI